ncbi:hypothetical protein NKG99_04170 [Mesorhizobium sp. M1409]|uniref:hypothetical protein n=1 Tax=Mesorhizobium sp. M1409 TaxID=2957100 RepID=UPI0033381DBC
MSDRPDLILDRLRLGDMLHQQIVDGRRQWWFDEPFQDVPDAVVAKIRAGGEFALVEVGDSLFGLPDNSQTWEMVLSVYRKPLARLAATTNSVTTRLPSWLIPVPPSFCSASPSSLSLSAIATVSIAVAAPPWFRFFSQVHSLSVKSFLVIFGTIGSWSESRPRMIRSLRPGGNPNV